MRSVSRSVGFAWLTTIAVVAVDALWLAAADWTVQWKGLSLIAIFVTAVSAPLLFPRYHRDAVLRTVLSTLALLMIFTTAAVVLSYLVISTNLPLVDSALNRADRTIGFDWTATHTAVARHPWLAMTLATAYASGTFQIVIVVVLLGVIRCPQRINEFARLFIIACIVTIVLSAPFPAAGTHKFYGVESPLFDLSMLSHFEPLRDGSLRVIPLGEMQGLVSIPSMHAATAVLLAWSTRGTRLFVPFALTNALMLAGTPVFGSHYLVDIIAGIALIGLLILIDRYLIGSAAPRATAVEQTPQAAGMLAGQTSMV